MNKSYTFNFSNSNNNDKSRNNLNNFKLSEEELIPGKHIIRNLINFSMSLGVFNSTSIGNINIINNQVENNLNKKA